MLLVVLLTAANAQSNSYLTIRDTFKKGHDVYHFGVSGFLCRTILAWADEYEFRDAITDVQNIKFITIPKSEFANRNVTLNGFKKILKEDAFQELAHFRDNGDYVDFYIQEKKNNNNRYFILVDEGENILAIEMKGYVDMNKLMSLKSEMAYNNN